ncbi:abnormal spindle-like microcephaly-associated protein homolog [Panonychus citri]|uniref:abnormal spindle-like microcephaly-associated protein homolog n=1 Tax=Panonychus citri TaxID=50023 RepID=UPI002308015D|nr:abnormal spindle-like microcephaly-associated protein homolog [Panonychus citri]
MSNSFYQCENSSLNYPNTCHRVCKFEIPAPSPKRIIPENEETPVLLLESFQRPSILNFGNVTLGNISTKSFKIHNPAHFIQKLDVVKVPKPEFGFTIKESSIVVDENQSVEVVIEWKPTKAGGTRQKVHFKTSYGESFELIVIGVAQEKWKTVTKRRVKPRRRPVIKLEKIALSPVDPNEIRRVEAAIVIQKFVRRYLAVKRFRALKRATITIQKHFRRYYAQKSINRRITFIKAKKSEALQEFFQSIRENGPYKKLISNDQKLEESSVDHEENFKRDKAAIVIQKFVRCHLAVKRFLALKRAAITIQRHFRRYYATMKPPQELCQSIVGNESLEKLMSDDRKQEASSVDQEESFKLCLLRLEKVDLSPVDPDEIKRVDAAVVIQKFVRRYLAVKRFLALKKATITIQKRFKKLLSDAKKQEESSVDHDESIRRVEAAIVIQKFVRRYLVARNFLTLKEATMKPPQELCQSIVENESLEKLILDDQKLEESSVDHDKSFKKVEAAMIIQKFVRRYLAVKRFRTLKRATITIQKHFRKRISDAQKQKVHESIKRMEAAIVIQKSVRRHLAARKFITLKRATITIQKHFRRYYATIKPPQELVQSIVENESLEKLMSDDQKQDESSVFHDEIKRAEAAIVIQKFIRRYLAFKRFLTLKEATNTMKPPQELCQSIVENGSPEKLILDDQPLEESSVDHDEIKKRVDAAVVIQKFVRRYLAVKRFRTLKRATTTIQKHFRKLMSDAQKQKVNESIKRDKAAIVIQKFVRRHLAARKFLALKEATNTIKPPQELRQSIIETGPPKKLISVCVDHLSVDESLQVNDTPELPIGFRTNLALTKLVNYRKFIQLQSALSSLETTTKISPESCIKISSPKTVDTIINIIKMSNRSEPSKIVVSSAFNILLNLIKYDKTQDLIVTCHSIINLCIEKAKVYIRVHHISNKCLTLLYLMIIKNVNRDLIICDPIVNKSLKSLINLESSTIKSHKKHKITKELVFYPYWSSAKSVMYEFNDHFTALEHINYLFKGKLF